MTHETLQALTEPDFLLRYSATDNASILYQQLRTNPHVRRLRHALWSGALTEDAIDRFVSTLLSDCWEAGTCFPYQIALAAIGVAIESRPTDFAEEYISDLASIDRVELQRASRIARVVQSKRKQVVPGHTERTCQEYSDGSVQFEHATRATTAQTTVTV